MTSVSKRRRGEVMEINESINQEGRGRGRGRGGIDQIEEGRISIESSRIESDDQMEIILPVVEAVGEPLGSSSQGIGSEDQIEIILPVVEAIGTQSYTPVANSLEGVPGSSQTDIQMCEFAEEKRNPTDTETKGGNCNFFESSHIIKSDVLVYLVSINSALIKDPRKPFIQEVQGRFYFVLHLFPWPKDLEAAVSYLLLRRTRERFSSLFIIYSLVISLSAFLSVLG